MLKNGINILRGRYEAVFVPISFSEKLPVFLLNLFVGSAQPGFKSKRLMDENDRNFQFFIFRTYAVGR